MNILGASKCRGMKSKIDEGDGGERDTDFFTSLQNQAKEVKSCGKRGASMKLKRALEEETREMAAKEGQKQKYKCDTSTTASATEKKTTKRKTKNDTSLSEAAPKKSKSQITKDLKLKEMMAFAGVSSAESPQVADSNISMESQGRQSPRKITTIESRPSTDAQSSTESQSKQQSVKQNFKSKETTKTSVANNTSDENPCSPGKNMKSTDGTSLTGAISSNKPQCRRSPKKKAMTDSASASGDNSPNEPQVRRSPRKKTLTDSTSLTGAISSNKPQCRRSPKKKAMTDSASASGDNSPNEPRVRRSPRKKTLTDSTSATGVASGFQGRQTETVQHTSATVPSETSTEKTFEPEQTTSATSLLVSSSLNLLNSNDLDPTDLEYKNTGEVCTCSSTLTCQTEYNKTCVYLEILKI